MAEPPDIEDLARRFLDLWRQHLTAMATDPAANPAASSTMGPDAWMAMTQLWTQGGEHADGTTSDAPYPPASGAASGAAGGAADNTMGPTPVAGASGGGGDAVRDLERRIGELEDRIAALEPADQSDP